MSSAGKKLSSWLGIEVSTLHWREWILLLAPFAIFFSYHPLISLGRGNYETHYELSLTEIYLVIFGLVNLPLIWKHRQKLLPRTEVRLSALFAVYSTISAIWTPDRPRGILTAGIIWLLVMFFWSLLITPRLKQLQEPLLRALIGSALFMSMFALYQMLAGSFAATAETTLLCPGCEPSQFGFVRPNGFAVEPQFFGSLLLAPALLLLHRVLSQKRHAPTYLAYLFLVSTIILTLSRGAIYSLIIATCVMVIVDWRYRRQLPRVITAGGISLVVALFLQGFTAAINPTVTTTFSQAITASVAQLTLGKVHLPVVATPTLVSPVKETSEPAIFTGYIPRSTNDRVSNTCRTAGIWLEQPARTLFGVGLGGTGYYFATEPTRSAPWCKINS